MPELLVTRGLPGSAKTTWANAWVAEDRGHRMRVSRDDIRSMVHGDYLFDPALEDRITAIEEAAVAAGLKQGLDVVVDATHLAAKHARRWFKLTDNVHFVDFPLPPEECGNRDAERKRLGGRGVGRDVIFGMANRFHIPADGTLPPAPVPLPTDQPRFAPYEPDPTLPDTFIFDIDGTLAKMNDRSPYDGTLYHTDTVHEHVANMLALLHRNGHTIIVVTGRDESWRNVTEDWLAFYGLLPKIERVFMRGFGDNRNDAIVKAEILHRDIAHRYHVLGVFDDRDRVVAAWRAMGIPTYQVADGNF